ncbi:MAG: aldose 1-epimerase family protein [Lachnospiraceae bacterium]|jgi:galactose mutarotase-like enzyme|nr:aldose 1-epimerase family protein [Lachnospiraceae bacterium]
MARKILKNDTIAVTIDSCGAEMVSLQNAAGEEYLWNGDPAYWKRHAPVLFPLVGSLKNKQYRLGDKIYQMNQHGFARDMEFSFLEEKDGECWFRLTENMATLTMYPYEFILDIGYRIGDNCLENIWRVTNPASRPLHFSIGGHPAFVCPRRPGESQTAYALRFDTDKPLLASVIGEGGLVQTATRPVATDGGLLVIGEHLFDKDALVIEENQAHRVSLVDPEGVEYVTVSFDAPLFGVWSCPGKKAPFVCIEPWYGRCDGDGFTGSWEERIWGNTLAPGECFEGGFKVEIR